MSKEIVKAPSEEALEVLRESYPVEAGFDRISLSRFGMVSQNQTEGTGKSLKVVVEAGTFFIEKETDELNEEGGKVWEKTELGNEAEITVVYTRKQLKYFDETASKFTSSPIYDNDDEILPLFCDKKEIDKGTPAELQSKYPGTTLSGKPKSNLEVNRVLYVLYSGEVYQLNLRGSSMFSWLSYSRKVLPPSVLTKVSSEAKQKGSTQWNQMSFETVRALDAGEIQNVIGKVTDIKEAIAAEKAFYSRAQGQTVRGEVISNLKNPEEIEFD